MTDPLPAPDLADVVAPMLAARPRREPSRYDRAARRYLEPLAVRDVAEALAAFFAPALALHLEGEDDRRLIVRVSPDGRTAEHITRATFTEYVARALRHLPDAPPSASYDTRRAVEHTRLLAERGPVGYVRRIADMTTDRLPLLADRDPRPALIRANVRPAAPDAAERRREYKREHQAGLRARAREGRRDDMITAAGWCSAWREQAEPGAHKASDVHSAYVARVEEVARAPVGRTDFYRIADEVCGSRKRRGDLGLVYVIPEEVQPMTREQRRELAAMIVDKLTDEWRAAALDGLAGLLAERKGRAASVPAPAVADGAQVVDLASRRARRVA